MREDYTNKDSFSQEGEDLILKEMLSDVREGFYIDVGSHHPYRFSNTQMFYEMGWRGINIDPTPGTKALFDEVRPEDTNLEVGIAKEAGTLTFYEFDETALNTFDKARANHLLATSPYKLKGEILVPVRPLAQVLEQYASKKTFTFLSVDVEKLEMEVLQSNDWERFRPRLLLIELLDLDLENLSAHSVHNYIKSLGYKLQAKTLRTTYYEDVSHA